MSDRYEPQALEIIQFGACGIVRGKMAHFGLSKTETVIQGHGIGPCRLQGPICEARTARLVAGGSPWPTLGGVSCGSGVTVGRLSPDRDRRGGGGLRGADAARHRDGTLTAAGRERSADSCSSDRRLEGSSGWLTPRSNAMMAGGQQLLCESTGHKLFARGIEHRL